MALVDARYRFIMVDVGANGRACDAGIFARSTMSTALEQNEVHIPPPRPLPGRVNSVPFVVVGDDAFGLKPHIMKPYPGREIGDFERIHNYRLSRARRVSENAFGILAKRFRVLDRKIHLDADKSTTVVNACIVLHNYLMTQTTRNIHAQPTRVLLRCRPCRVRAAIAALIRHGISETSLLIILSAMVR